MGTITVRLSDGTLERLQTLARQKKVSAEEMVQTTLEEWLGQPDSDFQRAARYVLE